MVDSENFWRHFNESTRVDELRSFLDSGGDLKYVHPKSGWSLLNLAIEHKNYAIIRALVAAGAKLNASQLNATVPIFHALDIDIDTAIQQNKKLNFQTTLLLIELGADPKIRDRGRSLRDLAGNWGDSILKDFDKKVASLI